MSCARPGVVVGAVPEESLGADEEVGREPAQALLRAELEERVRLEPRLLGLRRTRRRATAPCDAVERRADDVEVGRASASFHSSGKTPSARSSASSVERLDRVLGSATRSPRAACAERARRARRRASSMRAAPPRRAGRARLSRSPNACAAPSRNVIASWISKSSVTRPSSTPRPYSTGTSARKRRNWPARRCSSSAESGAARKPGERRVERRARLRVRGRRRRRARPPASASKPRRALGRAAASALRAIRSREDVEVAARERRLAAAAGREAALGRLVGRLERGAQARLVGVEEVGAYRRERRFGRVVVPRASDSSASVASAPGREKRVGLRNSRTSSQRARPGDVAGRVTAATTSGRRPRSTAVRTSARAAASRAVARRGRRGGPLAPRRGAHRRLRAQRPATSSASDAATGRRSVDVRAASLGPSRMSAFSASARCVRRLGGELPGRRRSAAAAGRPRARGRDERERGAGRCARPAGARHATARSRSRAGPQPARPDRRSPSRAPAPRCRACRPPRA